jgi:Tol biopolymer transport system component
VVDLDSGLAYYDVLAQKAKTDPSISDPDRLETYPTWTPDGKYLYFCSAAFPWEDRDEVPPDDYDQCRYDLMKVSYDVDTDTWGTPETVLSSEETGLSIMLPRISPDGRFLLFCMCDYSCFPIYQPSSDLYMMDLETGDYWEPDINSDLSESWHSWSTNSRWIAFSSKRRDGVFTRSYISYVDESGEVHKPFIMPQKDPVFYDSYLKTYSVPEFVVEPLGPKPRQLAGAVRWPGGLEVGTPVEFETEARPALPGQPGQDVWREAR